ncbi:MAG TPA: RNA 2',3'-cyclic phosphodiesterase [Terriglobales bacterium]|nr:RNA 2',3'-cyclic phosphodiesterase [Terriglobales bacterium]
MELTNRIEVEIIVRDAKTRRPRTWSDLLCSTLPMRLFVALDIPETIRERIASFIEEVRTLVPVVRWVAPESLHVTLKFIGERPDGMVESIKESLRKISSPAIQISFRGCGFFPTEKSARVFWIGIEAGPALNQLVMRIEGELGPLGIEAERRPFSPHLTLARAGNDSGAPGRQSSDKPNRRFSPLQAKLRAMPPLDFGRMNAIEFFLYRSQLSSRGAQYSKVAGFVLSEA